MSAQPIIPWIGGKRRLVPLLLWLYPDLAALLVLVLYDLWVWWG